MAHADVVALVQSWAKPIYEHVEGSPRQPGDRVVIVDEGDGTGQAAAREGQEGVVEYLEYSCGCEQTYPDDPMVGVRFSDGKLCEFWPEELKPL